MKIINVTQGSPEWFAARRLKLTASHAQAIAANGKGLETYCHDLVAEYLSTAEKIQFTNEHTERGKKLEPEARSVYEFETNRTIEEAGFVLMDGQDDYVGCSPDGLIGNKEGGVELKCKMDREHLRQVIYGIDEIDTAHLWQIQMNMLICEAKWWDYVCYNPNFDKKIFITRIPADLKKHEELRRGFEAGKKKIKQILALYNN